MSESKIKSKNFVGKAGLVVKYEIITGGTNEYFYDELTIYGELGDALHLERSDVDGLIKELKHYRKARDVAHKQYKNAGGD